MSILIHFPGTLFLIDSNIKGFVHPPSVHELAIVSFKETDFYPDLEKLGGSADDLSYVIAMSYHRTMAMTRFDKIFAPDFHQWYLWTNVVQAIDQ